MNWLRSLTDHKPTEAELEAERQAKALEELTAKLKTAIEKDPAFQVQTVDGLHWMCPYTGEMVPCPFGYADTAFTSLMERTPWKGGKKPHELKDLLVARWRHFVQANHEMESRLRIFAPDGRWLNPYSGTWMARQEKDRDLANKPVVKEIAALLAKSPGRKTPPMLAWETLQQVLASELASANRVSDELLSISEAGLAPITDEEDEALAPAAAATPAKAGSATHALTLPVLSGFRLHGAVDPATGGFIETLPLADGKLLLLVGDVTGSGLPGGAPAAATLLRKLAVDQSDPLALATVAGAAIRRLVAEGPGIRLAICVLDPQARTLTSLFGGHPELLLFNPNRAAPAQRIGRPGLAIGASSGTGAAQPGTLRLEPYDLVVIHGVAPVKVVDDKKRAFGLHRLLGTVFSTLDRPGSEVMEAVCLALRRHAGSTKPIPQEGAPLLLLRVAPPAK